MLQTRKQAQETTARDLYIKALQTIPKVGYLPRHPCAITSTAIIWTQSEEDLHEIMLNPDGLGPDAANVIGWCKKIQSALSDGKGKEIQNFQRLLCRAHSNNKAAGKKHKRLVKEYEENLRVPGTNNEVQMDLSQNPELGGLVGAAMDVGQRQQKLFRWVLFCEHILEKMHDEEKPDTVCNLIRKTLKLTAMPEATKEYIDKTVLVTLMKVLEKGALTCVTEAEVKKTKNPLFTLGGLYVDYCYSQNDVRNLQSIFDRLPIGVGQYETLYVKPESFAPPEHLPLSGVDVDSDSIDFLGVMFYSCTSAISKAVEENVDRGLKRRYKKENTKFPKAKYPQKWMHTIIHPVVCSSWLKVLLNTGTILFPTQELTNVPGTMQYQHFGTISIT